MVVVEVPVPLDILGEQPQRGGDRGEGEVELRDLVEVEKRDLERLGARGEVGEGRSAFIAAVTVSAATYELAAEQEVGLSDRGDVLWMERDRISIFFFVLSFFPSTFFIDLENC